MGVDYRMSMEKYIGWVPCVAGKLFFTHMQCGLANKFSAITINHIEPDLLDGDFSLDKESGFIRYDRYVCLTSVYDWKDTLEGEGDFRVVVMGRATNNGSMEGCVFILPKSVGNEIQEWKKIITEIKALKKETQNAKRKKINFSVKNKFTEINDNLDNFKNNEYYKIPFKLDRSGFVTFDYQGIDKGHRQELTLVRQAFYYLKYSIHVHQHHHDGEDSLTTVHLIPKNKENIGEKLLDDLKESMVAMKREHAANGYHRLFDNKGVSCYAKSLIESCKKEKYISEENYQLQKNYLDNVYGSMETTAEKTKRKIDIGLAASSSARSVILLIFAVFAPFILIHLDNIRNDFKDINMDSLPSWLLGSITSIVTSTSGMLWLMFSLVMIYSFFRVIRLKQGSFILNVKYISSKFAGIAENWKGGYVIAVILFALCAGAVYAAFKYG